MAIENSFVVVSDSHLLSRDDPYYKKFVDLLDHFCELKISDLFLLGDIFHLMCGNHEEYFDRYKEFFMAIKRLASLGVQIHFMEGNHDIFIDKIFDKTIFQDEIVLKNSSSTLKEIKVPKIYRRPFVFNFGGKEFYFSHGDEILKKDPLYYAYTKILQSKLMGIIINKAPISWIDYVGEKLSDLSKSKRQKLTANKKINFTELRERYRIEIMKMARKSNIDILICGHNHIKDDFIFEIKGKKVQYLNNGYWKKEQSYIMYSLSKGATFEYF